VEDCGAEAAGYACEEDWGGHLLDGGVVGTREAVLCFLP